MNTPTIFLLLSVILLTGCVSMTKPIKYPQNNTANTISVSSKQIENLFEATAGDYFISDSQISVGGASNIASNPATNMFGLIGFGISLGIDKTKNYNAISKSSLNSPIKFDQLLQQKIKTELNKEPNLGGMLKTLNNNQEAHITLIPSARIDVTNKENIRTSYVISSFFKNALENNKDTRRTYYYLSSKKAPLAEWAKNNNAMFHETANQAYSAITRALILDIQNKLSLTSVASNPNMTCKSKLTTIYNLIESPADICIAVVRNQKNEVLQNMLFIIEQ